MAQGVVTLCKEETMPRRTLSRAMMVIIACVVLLSASPATTGAWIEGVIGSMTTIKPVSRTVVVEGHKDGDRKEVKGEQNMSVPLFLSGVTVLTSHFLYSPSWAAGGAYATPDTVAALAEETARH
jgi:hypothetical protein